METLIYAWAVLQRIVSVFAVAPAVACLMLFGFAYQFSFEAAARDAYGYIEQFARTGQEAPIGFLLMRECHESTAASSNNPPTLKTCEKTELKQVSVDVLANEAAASLASVYWMLVLVGLGINLLIMGPRRFFLMERNTEQSSAATPVARK